MVRREEVILWWKVILRWKVMLRVVLPVIMR